MKPSDPLALWHWAQRSKRGARPKIEPAYVGNRTGQPTSRRTPGSPINCIGNLQHALTAEAKASREAARKAEGG